MQSITVSLKGKDPQLFQAELEKTLDSKIIRIDSLKPLQEDHYTLFFSVQGRPEARSRASRLICRKVNELGGEAHGRAIERPIR